MGGVGGCVAFEEGAIGADQGVVGVVGEDVDVGGACFDTSLVSGGPMERRWE